MGSSTGSRVEGDPDLEHLRPEIRPITCLPAEERLRFVRADRWIGYTRAAAALERLEELYGWPGRQRMPNMLLIGPTNNGKSMIVEKFRRTHPQVSHPDREEIPVLVVQMPSEPSVTRFYVAVLAAMGAPLRPRQRLAELEQATLALLRAVGDRDRPDLGGRHPGPPAPRSTAPRRLRRWSNTSPRRHRPDDHSLAGRNDQHPRRHRHRPPRPRDRPATARPTDLLHPKRPCLQPYPRGADRDWYSRRASSHPGSGRLQWVTSPLTNGQL